MKINRQSVIPHPSPIQADGLAHLWSIPLPPAGTGRLETALRERIKELNCLYGISKLAEKHHSALDAFIEGLVNFVPHSWQYSEKTCARVIFKDLTYHSDNFQESQWYQSASICLYKEPAGECTIFYTAEFPPADEGPFLKEERALLDAIADQISSIAEKIFADLELQEMNQQLKLERQALRETNTALKVVLSRNENEKKEIHRDIKHNAERILLPIVDSLAFHLPLSQRKYIDLLKSNLKEITSPFLSGLARHFYALSPTELMICNMIKNGMTTKEIAETRGVSSATINHHREKIRRKLKITNQDVNLATFLQHNIIEPE